MTKGEDFLDKPVLSGELEEVPGFGAKGIANLHEKGIHTTYQIFAKFLELGRDADKLKEWLVSPEIGMHKPTMTRADTVHYIEARLLDKGFKCNIKLSDRAPRELCQHRQHTHGVPCPSSMRRAAAPCTAILH